MYLSLNPGETAVSTLSKEWELARLAEVTDELEADAKFEVELETGPPSSKLPKDFRGSRHGGRHQVSVPEHLSNFRNTEATCCVSVSKWRTVVPL